jgi:hypothetical protein
MVFPGPGKAPAFPGGFGGSRRFGGVKNSAVPGPACSGSTGPFPAGKAFDSYGDAVEYQSAVAQAAVKVHILRYRGKDTVFITGAVFVEKLFRREESGTEQQDAQ